MSLFPSFDVQAEEVGAEDAAHTHFYNETDFELDTKYRDTYYEGKELYCGGKTSPEEYTGTIVSTSSSSASVGCWSCSSNLVYTSNRYYCSECNTTTAKAYVSCVCPNGHNHEDIPGGYDHSGDFDGGAGDKEGTHCSGIKYVYANTCDHTRDGVLVADLNSDGTLTFRFDTSNRDGIESAGGTPKTYVISHDGITETKSEATGTVTPEGNTDVDCTLTYTDKNGVDRTVSLTVSKDSLLRKYKVNRSDETSVGVVLGTYESVDEYKTVVSTLKTTGVTYSREGNYWSEKNGNNTNAGYYYTGYRYNGTGTDADVTLDLLNSGATPTAVREFNPIDYTVRVHYKELEADGWKTYDITLTWDTTYLADANTLPGYTRVGYTTDDKFYYNSDGTGGTVDNTSNLASGIVNDEVINVWFKYTPISYTVRVHYKELETDGWKTYDVTCIWDTVYLPDATTLTGYIRTGYTAGNKFYYSADGAGGEVDNTKNLASGVDNNEIVNVYFKYTPINYIVRIHYKELEADSWKTYDITCIWDNTYLANANTLTGYTRTGYKTDDKFYYNELCTGSTVDNTKNLASGSVENEVIDVWFKYTPISYTVRVHYKELEADGWKTYDISLIWDTTYLADATTLLGYTRIGYKTGSKFYYNEYGTGNVVDNTKNLASGVTDDEIVNVWFKYTPINYIVRVHYKELEADGWKTYDMTCTWDTVYLPDANTLTGYIRTGYRTAEKFYYNAQGTGSTVDNTKNLASGVVENEIVDVWFKYTPNEVDIYYDGGLS